MQSTIKIGIQGGNGSFNHQACLSYVEEKQIKDFEIDFLYTTQNVLDAVSDGRVSLGQFAIYNTLGGFVEETLTELGKHTFAVLDTITIKIIHCMMKHKNVPIEKIDTVMAHPQVFKQCHVTLQKQFPHYRQIVGEKEFIDHARVAEGLAINELPDNIAVIGSKALSDMYQLDIIAENLQDSDANFTSFLIVTPWNQWGK